MAAGRKTRAVYCPLETEMVISAAERRVSLETF